MVLVKNWKFFERFVLCKRNPEKVFGDVLVRKQAFLDNINMDLKRRQNWDFCKGDSPWFWWKSWSFFNVFCLSKIDREKVFRDVLDKKEAFKDYKNNCLWKTENENFFKGVSPLVWSKFQEFFNFDFYAKSTKKKYLRTF